MMLPLEQLTIHRFRGLIDLDLSALGRFNVLVGRNNSGKTTVLEAVATFARPTRPSEWIEVVRRRDLTSSRAALIEGLKWLFPAARTNGESARFFSTTHVSGRGSSPVMTSTATFREVEGFFEGEETPEVPATEDASGSAAAARPQTRHGAELVLRARIQDPPEAFHEESHEVTLWETGRGPIAQNAAGSSLPIATITPFSHRVPEYEVEAVSNAIIAEQKATVLDLIRIFEPEIEDIEVLKRPHREAAVYVRHKRLGRAPLSAFGDGMRRVLLMGVSLSTVRGGILLVDEIESAIHADALESTFRWLHRGCRELGVQLFATTHSLEAVDALLAVSEELSSDDFVVHRLERRDEKTLSKRFGPERLRVLREELGQEIRA